MTKAAVCTFEHCTASVRVFIVTLFFIAASFLFTPTAHAQTATLTPAQIQAILNILYSFGADQGTVNDVNAAIQETQPPMQMASAANTAPTSAPAATPSGTPIDIFLIVGQSNMLGLLSAPSWDQVNQGVYGPVPQSGTAYVYNPIAGSLDPVGSSEHGAWPQFAITYYKNTNHKVLFVQAAAAGSSLTQGAADFAGHALWGSGSTLYNNSLAYENAAMQVLRAQGYAPTFKGVLFGQGESDALAGAGAASYQQALVQLISAYRGALGQNTPFYLFRTGTNGTDASTTAAFARIRDAQEAAVLSTPNAYIVFREASSYPSEGFQAADSLHYTQAGYNEMGLVGAQGVVSSVNQQQLASAIPSSAPQITNFTVMPSAISPGQSATLSWNAANVNTCTVYRNESNGSLSIITSGLGNGSFNFVPFSSATYTLSCAAAGSVAVNQTAAITVAGKTQTPLLDTQAQSPTPISANPVSSPAGVPAALMSANANTAAAVPTCTIASSASSVAAGGSATLSWSSQNASSATLLNVGTESPTGSAQVGILNGTNTFTLQVSGSGGSGSCTVSVTGTASTASAQPASGSAPSTAPAVTSVSVSSANVALNDSVRVFWSVANPPSDGKINLWLYDNHGNNLGNVANSLSPTAGTYTWTVSSAMGMVANQPYLVSAQLFNTNSSVNVANFSNWFTYTAPASAAAPAVTGVTASANGSTSFGLNSSVRISWSTTSAPSDGHINIWLYDNAGHNLGNIASGLPISATSYTWTVSSAMGMTSGQPYIIGVQVYNPSGSVNIANFSNWLTYTGGTSYAGNSNMAAAIDGFMQSLGAFFSLLSGVDGALH